MPVAFLLACASRDPAPKAPSAAESTPSQQGAAAEVTMITTTVFYKLKNGALSDVRAEGPSDALKQSCIRDLQQTLQAIATSRPDVRVGEAVGPGEWKIQCFDTYPK